MVGSVEAIRFKQWLAGWDEVSFDPAAKRAEPGHDLFLFSMSASELRTLSVPFRRERTVTDQPATGIQRNLDPGRAGLIHDYVQFGYPYSEMSESRRSKFDLSDLRKPGWLPTAIIVNILKPGDRRRERNLHAEDVINIRGDGKICELDLPVQYESQGGWAPQDLPPFEIIDGQHRLYAFDKDGDLPGDFELPVVAFHGLDMGWQAYLFWTINISPKKINRSHAFDLYPLLRTQDWLEKFDEAVVYREARAQELTDYLYSHPESVWQGRINMLGEGRDRGRVSQAGWVRALVGSVLARRSKATGGLFGDNVGIDELPLDWSRPQQAAFLIMAWQECQAAVRDTDAPWAAALRQEGGLLDVLGHGDDPAFFGNHTLLNQEQGLRGVLTVLNDYFYIHADRIGLASWSVPEPRTAENLSGAISAALQDLADHPIRVEARLLMEAVARFDWRSSDAPNIDDRAKRDKQAYRGSSGYGVLKEDLYSSLALGGDDVGQTFSSAVRG